MKLTLNLKSDTPFDFPPEGHREVLAVNTRLFLFIMAALLSANIVYANLVTHNSTTLSAGLGAASLLVGVLMTLFPRSAA